MTDVLARAHPSHAPIGVFDSGVGGLSVLREIRRELPGEDLVYAADSLHAPYGDKSVDEVRERALHMADFLVFRGAKAVVVACNTATEIAIDALRARYTVPIVAMEPAVKPAVAATRSGVVAVLATSQTLASPKYRRLVETHAGQVRVVSRPCPGLVERVEAGDLESVSTYALVDEYVVLARAEGADTLVLGCTHFPFLLPAIREAAGSDVTIVDPAVPVARQLRRRLEASGLLAPETRRGAEEFWTTGARDRVEPVLAMLWGTRVNVREVPPSQALAPTCPE